MLNIFDINELKYIIISYLDLKSIILMMRIDHSTYQLIHEMPLYKQLIKCVHGAIRHPRYYTWMEKLFLEACCTSQLYVIHNICRNYKENILQVLNTGLIWACGSGHLSVVEILVDYGANIRATYDSALRWACGQGQLDVVKFLMERGADAHAFNDYAILVACEHGHTNIIDFFIRKGIKLNSKCKALLTLAIKKKK